jgi:hypothetical protein
MFRTLNVQGFEKPATTFEPGPAPQLMWVSIDELSIDLSYQREIGKRGAQNIRQIAENFDWSKFAPIIVAPKEGGGYAIVDGQHRCRAALLRGIERVPCQVVQADRAKQAQAYAAVNGNVTQTTPQQLYHARLAAGDPQALLIHEVCAAASVTVLRRNLMSKTLKPGEPTRLEHFGDVLDSMDVTR